MGCVGYVVSIPVFFDSGFVLLSPLMKALARKAGITLAASAIALSLGLYATHAWAGGAKRALLWRPAPSP